MLGGVTGVTPAAAQDTIRTAPRTSPDSIAARLERAEEMIEFLKQQMADQSAIAIHTRSRIEVELTGRVLVNAFSNTRRVTALDAPVFVRPDTAGGPPPGGAGMGIRQTTIGFSAAVADVLGGNLTADVDADFYGGQDARTMTPIVRLRTSRVAIHWPHADVMVGQDDPLISTLNPVSLAAVGVPGFSAAGNLWDWLPQVRLGVHTAGSVRVGLQGAVIAPSAGVPQSSADDDLAESARRPYLESRAHLSWGADATAGEIGIGIHEGWLATPNSTAHRETRGVGVDAMVPFNRWLEFRGEWYAGDGMRVLGGGAIGQLFDTNNAPVHSAGFWGQVNVTPVPRVTFGAGYGQDDPADANLPATARLRNAAAEVHLHIRPGGPVVLGIEYRRMETTYRTGPLVNDHINVAMGIVL